MVNFIKGLMIVVAWVLIVGMIEEWDYRANNGRSPAIDPGTEVSGVKPYGRTTELPECPDNMKGSNTVLLLEVCPSKDATWNRKALSADPIYCDISEYPYGEVGHSTRVIGAYRDGGGAKDVYVWYFDYGRGETIEEQPDAFKFAQKCGIDTVMVPLQSTRAEIYSGFKGNKKEAKAIADYIGSGGTVWASAGNHGVNLSKLDSYPASYPGVLAVGALDCKGEYLTRAKYSNYGGKVKYWACGEFEDSQGTSYSMPRYVGMREAENKNTFIGFIRSLFGLP